MRPGIEQRRAALREHVIAVEGRLVLRGEPANAVAIEGGCDGSVARLRVGLVIAIRKHGADLQLHGERGNHGAGIAMAHDETATLRGERAVELGDRRMDELDATIGAIGKRIENRGVVHERASNVPAALQCGGERGMVVVAEVAAHPAERALESKHAWRVGFG